MSTPCTPATALSSSEQTEAQRQWEPLLGHPTGPRPRAQKPSVSVLRACGHWRGRFPRSRAPGAYRNAILAPLPQVLEWPPVCSGGGCGHSSHSLCLACTPSATYSPLQGKNRPSRKVCVKRWKEPRDGFKPLIPREQSLWPTAHSPCPTQGQPITCLSSLTHKSHQAACLCGEIPGAPDPALCKG